MPSHESTPERSVADEFEARAATFRRVATDLRCPADRDELLRIAASYEEDAARLRESGARSRN
jgi:hypothetical protein